MANHSIEITLETGERTLVPLWKFPQLCAEAVETYKEVIASIKAAEDAKAAEEAAARERHARQVLADAAAIAKPFDLAKKGG